MKRINGALQHYPWGRSTAIAELRRVEPSGRPEAEYWLGAHPRGPSRVVADDGGEGPPLDSVIAAKPDYWLGPSVRDQFGELPFLLKILAAEQPLSIQAHPNAEQARAGFEREDRDGIDRDDFKRNYRDPNHKPELICALSTFEAKCGFRDLDDTRRLFSLLADRSIEPLRARLGGDGESSAVLVEVVTWLLDLGDRDAAVLVDAVVSDARRLLASAGDAPAVAGFRADLEWTVRINDTYPGDIGVAVALLLNHLILQPGQALFLEAGLVHAYLRGVAVELMANSDNVLRCGLTSKHIDVDELLSVAVFEPGRPPVQTMTGSTHQFASPVPEFALTVHRADDDTAPPIWDVIGPEIVLVETGSAILEAMTIGEEKPLRVSAGEAVAVPAAVGRYQVTADGPGTSVWRASVGR